MASQADNPKRDRHTRILRLQDVMDRLRCSRSTVYRLDKKGTLRRAKKLDGSTSSGWHEDSVEDYVESIRPDPIDPSESADSGQKKTSKSSALKCRGRNTEVTENLGQTTIGPEKTKGSKRAGASPELQATTMMIMGNKVYFHAPTGKLFLEIGKAPAFLTGIDVAFDEGTMDDAERPSASSEPAIRKRRAASL